MSNLLSEMGIMQWQLRSAEPVEAQQAAPERSAYQFMFVLLASQADQNLLSKIMHAMNCDAQQANVLVLKNADELQSQHWPDIPTIIFGEALHLYGPATAIRTVSLLDLAENLPAKKSLWQSLKQLS